MTNDKKILKFLAALKEQKKADAKVRKAFDSASGDFDTVWPKKPKNLRKATSRDIKTGAIIWYQMDYGDHAIDTENKWYWKLVMGVLHHNDPYKAYEDYEGGRYGLEGAFVEQKL